MPFHRGILVKLSFLWYCFVLFQSVWPFEHCECDQSNVIWGKLKLAFTEQLYTAVFFCVTKWCSNIPLTSTQSISRFPLWKLLGIEINKYINKCIHLFIYLNKTVWWVLLQRTDFHEQLYHFYWLLQQTCRAQDTHWEAPFLEAIHAVLKPADSEILRDVFLWLV